MISTTAAGLPLSAGRAETQLRHSLTMPHLLRVVAPHVHVYVAAVTESLEIPFDFDVALRHERDTHTQVYID